jgi:alcohol dehydrogenase
MNWTQRNPTIIHGGAGSAALLPQYIKKYRVLLLTTPGMLQRGTAKSIMSLAPSAVWLTQTVEPNPDLDALDSLSRQLRGDKIEAVVALGGGSAIDSGKALSLALAAERGWSPAAYFRGKGEVLPPAALPLYCLPTTAGTGAEVTPFATIWDRARQKKLSLATPSIYPAVAFLDPELTLSLPWAETLNGSMDALSHALETLWNKHATPVSLLLAREVVALIDNFLPRLQDNGADRAAREKVQQAATLAGMAISQNRTALAHAVSYPLTLHFGMPHGLACSFTLSALTKLVSKKNKWVIPQDEALANRAADMVKHWKLRDQVMQYCSPVEVYSLVEEMFTPERAGNFVVGVNKKDLLDILHNSLAFHT